MELDDGTMEQPVTLEEYVILTARQLAQDHISRRLSEAINLGYVTFEPVIPNDLTVAYLYFEDRWSGDVYGPRPYLHNEGDLHFTENLLDYLDG